MANVQGGHPSRYPEVQRHRRRQSPQRRANIHGRSLDSDDGPTTPLPEPTDVETIDDGGSVDSPHIGVELEFDDGDDEEYRDGDGDEPDQGEVS